METTLVRIFKKYPKFMGFILIFMLISSSIYFLNFRQNQTNSHTEAPYIRQESVLDSNNNNAVPVSYTVRDPKKIRVILSRVYLDGEISEEIVEETIWSMEDFWAEYHQWDLVDQDEEQIVFRQKIDDISPLLKINGYFGISEEGTLNIYHGNPSEEKVIQSFFQINTKELKSHQQQELRKGIPVLSRDRYEEVLKTYKKYAKQEI